MQAKLPAARARSVEAVSAVDAREASGSAPGGQAAVPRLTYASGRCQDVRGVPRPTQQEALVRLRQAAVRRSESRARLSVTVYAPRRHLEPSPDRSRPTQRHVQGQELQDRRPRPVHDDDARRRGVHPPVLHPGPPKGFHRLPHHGLLASANRAETIARARELLGLATPAAEAAIEIDAAAAQPLAQPCPCCGGRMFVIETFDAGCQPRYRPTAMRMDTS